MNSQLFKKCLMLYTRMATLVFLQVLQTPK